MSEKTRQGIGIALILISILLCFAAAVHSCDRKEVRFRSGLKQEYGIAEIRTEKNGPVYVNDAEPDGLIILPGIGETLAGLIIQEYISHGPYYYAEDLESVRGIGPVTLNRFRDLIDLSQGESGE